MDKITEKKMNDFILLLHSINELDLPLNPDEEIAEKIEKKLYNDCSYFSSICRMHGIQPNGNVRDEFQILFNEGGFAIEQDKKGKHPFFIRTEKGLIRF